MEQLEGGYLDGPEVKQRINKPGTDAIDISRIFNDLHCPKEIAKALYEQCSTHSELESFQTISDLVKDIDQKIVPETSNEVQPFASIKAVLNLDDCQSRNNFRSALITAYMLEIGKGSQLSQGQLAEPDEFTYFKMIANTVTQNASEGKDLMSGVEDRLTSKDSDLLSLWADIKDNINKVMEVISVTHGCIDVYLARNGIKMSKDRKEQLNAIMDQLSNAHEAFGLGKMDVETFKNLETVQQKLIAFKKDLKTARKWNPIAISQHQGAKLKDPLTTISGIAAHLGQSLQKTFPAFIIGVWTVCRSTHM